MNINGLRDAAELALIKTMVEQGVQVIVQKAKDDLEKMGIFVDMNLEMKVAGVNLEMFRSANKESEK